MGVRRKSTEPFTLKDMCDDVVGVMTDSRLARAIAHGLQRRIGHLDPAGVWTIRSCSHALILVGGKSGASSRYMKRIEGYRVDLAGYHIKHMRELVTPGFARIATWAIISSTCSSNASHDYPAMPSRTSSRAGNRPTRTNALARHEGADLVINGEFDHSLTAGQRTASLVPGARAQDPAGHRARVLYRRPVRASTAWSSIFCNRTV